MASRREIVHLPGTIRGNGLVARCSVRAEKVSNGPNVAFAKFTIETVTPALPAGDYELSLIGEAQRVRFEGGHWLSALPG